MNLYIYSDESGVFDKAHNNYFVFGGIICIDNNEKEMLSRKYSSIGECQESCVNSKEPLL